MTRSQEVRAALKDLLPVAIAVAPFGAVFAALATERGLSFWEVMFASATIFAGASQYAMLDLMGQQVAPWAIIVAIFAINFRHVLYSASVGRHMGLFSPFRKYFGFFFLMDPLFAASEARARSRQLTPTYFFTYGLTLYANWLIVNALGAQFGKLIEDPAAFGLDVILPVYFTGLVMAFWKSENFSIVLFASVSVSLVTWWWLGTPWNITLGGFAGLIAAAALSKPDRGSRFGEG